jgi:hypothetical protein
VTRALTADEIARINEVADVLAQTALIGRDLSPETLAGLGIIGGELGLAPAEAMRALYVTKDGSPVASADLLLRLLRDGGVEVSFPFVSRLSCTVVMERETIAGAHWVRFSVAGGTTELFPAFASNYPFGWVRSRAVAALARMVAPDLVGRLVTPEEEVNDRFFEIEGGTLDASSALGKLAAPPAPAGRHVEAAPTRADERAIETVAHLRVALAKRTSKQLLDALLRTASAFLDLEAGRTERAADAPADPDVAAAKARMDRKVEEMRRADGATAKAGRAAPQEPSAAERPECDRIAARFGADTIELIEQLEEVAKNEGAAIAALSTVGRAWCASAYSTTKARLRRAEKARRGGSEPKESGR